MTGLPPTLHDRDLEHAIVGCAVHTAQGARSCVLAELDPHDIFEIRLRRLYVVSIDVAETWPPTRYEAIAAEAGEEQIFVEYVASKAYLLESAGRVLVPRLQEVAARRRRFAELEAELLELRGEAA